MYDKKYEIGDRVRYINEKKVNTIVAYALTDQSCSYTTEDDYGQQCHNIAEINLVKVDE